MTFQKIRRHPVETVEEKYRCTQTLSRQGATVEQVCRALEVSRSGYYGWLRHKPGMREQRNLALKRKLVELHEKSPFSFAPGSAWVGDITDSIYH